MCYYSREISVPVGGPAVGHLRCTSYDYIGLTTYRSFRDDKLRDRGKGRDTPKPVWCKNCRRRGRQSLPILSGSGSPSVSLPGGVSKTPGDTVDVRTLGPLLGPRCGVTCHRDRDVSSVLLQGTRK